jgi:hypothetical protein
MTDARSLVLESALDDWVSDYEVQGDFQAEYGLEPSAAYEQMTRQATDWIRRGVLVAGDMTDGFVPWQGSANDSADRFADLAARRTVLTMPGQICWFDSGPNAADELTALAG